MIEHAHTPNEALVQGESLRYLFERAELKVCRPTNDRIHDLEGQIRRLESFMSRITTLPVESAVEALTQYSNYGTMDVSEDTRQQAEAALEPSNKDRRFSYSVRAGG